MADTLERARLSFAQPLAPTPNSADFFQPNREDGTSYWDSYSAAFQAGNLTLSGIRAGQTMLEEGQFRAQPGFRQRLGTFLNETPELNWLLQLSHDDPTVADALLGMESEDEVLFYARKHLETQTRLREAFDNPMTGVIGLLSGAVMDWPTLIPVGGVVSAVRNTTHTVAAMRASAATRVALFGAAEGGAQAAFESVDDLTMDEMDVLKWFGFGGAVGGALGGAFPRLGGQLINEERAARRAEQTAAEAEVRLGEEAPEGVGAASPKPRDPRQDLPESVRSWLSRGLDVLPGRQMATTPVQMMLNMTAEFGDLASVQRAYNFFGRLVRVDAASRSEAAGLSARTQQSVEEILGSIDTEYAAVAQAQGAAYRRLAKLAEVQDFMKKSVRQPRMAVASDTPAIPSWRTGLTEDEFKWLAEEWRVARFAESSYDDFINSRLPDAPREVKIALKKEINGAANEADNFWKARGKELADDGIIDEDQFQEVYRHQAYNPDADDDLLRAVLRDATKLSPPPEILDELGFGLRAFRELSAAEQEEALDLYREVRRAMLEGKRGRAATEAEQALEEETAEGAAILLRRVRARRAQLETHADMQGARLARATTATGKNRWLKAIAKTEEEIDKVKTQERKLLDQADDAAAVRKELEEIARKSREAKVKKEAAKAARAIGKAAQKAEKTEVASRAGNVDKAVDRLDTLLDEMIDNIKGRGRHSIEDIGHLHAEQTVGKGGATKTRHIDFTELEAANDPRLAEVLVRDPLSLFTRWRSQAATRLAFQRALGDKDPLKQINEIARDLPHKYREAWRSNAETIVKARTGQLFAGQSNSARNAAAFATGFNVMSMLGRVILPVIGDVAAIALTRRTTKLSRMLELFMRTKGIPEQLADMGENTQAALVAQAEYVFNDIARKGILDLGETGVGRSLAEPGSQLWKLEKMARQAGRGSVNTMMRLTLMHSWNTMWSRKMGVVLQTDMVDLIGKKFSTWEQPLREALATVGIDEAVVTRFAGHMKKHGMSDVGNGIQIPRIDAWPKRDKEIWMRMVRERQKQAIINPQPGTIPKIMHSPGGKVLFQFLSFPYSAQAKFLRPLLQSQSLALKGQILLIGLMGSAVADAARHALTGRMEQYAESWETPAGVTQRMTDIIGRSVFSVAMTATLADQALIAGGKPLNNLLELADLDPIVPEPSRLKQMNAIGALLGPSFASAQRIHKAGTTVLEAMSADPDAIEKLPDHVRRAMPFGNLIWLDLLEQGATILGDE